MRHPLLPTTPASPVRAAVLGRAPQAMVHLPNKARAQLDYSRPVSRVGSVGFAMLSITLAAMTFVITTKAIDLPIDLAAGAALADHDAVHRLPAPTVASDDDAIFEPKVTARLPVFGGMISER